MIKSKFTKNKQVVRDLQFETIKKFFTSQQGNLKYFGLPSEEMKDIIDWKPFFSKILAVERGDPNNFWEKQHLLMLTAFKNDIFSKTIILRGDIDQIILSGKDSDNNTLIYPFDVVSLDYSGGLLYREKNGDQNRLKAIRKVIEQQATQQVDFLLFISTNLDNCKDGEVKRVIEDVKTELQRSGYNASEVFARYLSHEKDEVRLKIYIPYFVCQIASSRSYNCETKRAIFYAGNKDTRMMNFRFCMKYNRRTTAPRFPKESLANIINSPMIQIDDAKCREVSLGLPKLRRQT